MFTLQNYNKRFGYHRVKLTMKVTYDITPQDFKIYSYDQGKTELFSRKENTFLQLFNIDKLLTISTVTDFQWEKGF